MLSRSVAGDTRRWLISCAGIMMVGGWLPRSFTLRSRSLASMSMLSPSPKAAGLAGVVGADGVWLCPSAGSFGRWVCLVFVWSVRVRLVVGPVCVSGPEGGEGVQIRLMGSYQHRGTCGLPATGTSTR